MDPLSIATAVLTCMSATGELISIVKKVNHLRQAPQEIEGLENEISALRSTAESVSKILETREGTNHDMLRHIPIAASVDSARMKIESIRQFLQDSLLDRRSDLRLKKSAWLKWQSEFNRLRQELRDKRIELGTCMSLFTASVNPHNPCVPCRTGES